MRATSRPARVLFPFEGALLGGSHMSAFLLIEGLDRSRFEPVILLHRDDGAVAAHLVARGLAFRVAPPAVAAVSTAASGAATLRAKGLLSGLAARVRWLRDERIDIVHSNEGLMHAAWSTAARLAGVRMLWHHRGHPQARGLRFLAPLCADKVVSVSRFSAPRPGFYSAANRCQVIRSPFERDLFDAAAMQEVPGMAPDPCRAELGIGPDTLLLGFFAHFAERKRPVMFVDAVAAVRRRLGGQPMLALMFGDTLEPGLDAAVDAAIRMHGLEGIVRCMGFRQPIAPWLAACDVNVVTAVDEPFGRTLIEAMLIGTVVVAARSGGSPEAIRDGETGLLVTPDDAEAFGAAIAGLTDPARRLRIADHARAEARRRFGVEPHVRAVSAVYAEMMAA